MKKLAHGIVLAFAAMSAAVAFATGERIPAGYTEVEYIQGDGSSTRILTDYTPNHLTDKIEAVVGWDAVDKTATIWCTRGATSSTDSWTVFMVNNSGYKFRLDYGTGKDGYASPLTVAANTIYTVTAEDKRIDVVGGAQPASYEYSQSSSFADAGPIMLFASYWNGTGNNLDNYGKNKLYSFKVWRSGNLIHYFVPCKDSNNVATLVDICDNPATLTKSGTFTAGGEGHYYDDSLFTIPDDTLAITGSPIDYGSPSPAYGKQTGLIAGETVAVNCGATAVTNAAGTREYICLGWNLYDEDGTVVSNGTETAFTYTHPNPAKGRRLQWQWTVRALSAISDAILPVGGAAFHVDASMYSTMTTVESSDGRKLVTAWRDADGGTMKATAGTGSRPWIVTNDGLPYVDFGEQRSGTPPSSSDLSGYLAWSSRLTTIREVFLVFSDYPGSAHSFFLGDGSGSTYDFHRNQLKLFNSQYASANVKNGLKEVDGVERTIDYELPSGFHIIHLRTTGNVTASSFARDRSNVNYGGQRLQEVVVYTSTLTDAQAGSVYNYLKAKWFTIKPDTLVIDGIPEQVGSPDPAYGMRTGLAAGDSFTVSCGATVVTNGSTECIYQGWKLYDQDYNLLTNGTETSFTYTHPSPAAGRMFEWQWKTRPVGADATDLLPTLCMTFNNQSLANTGTGTVTMNNEGTPTYVPSADGYALDAGVYVPYGTLSNVFAANRDSSIAVAATLGTKSTGILVSFRNASNGSVVLVLRRGNTANQVVLTENNASTPLITVNDIENADTEYHLYVMNILSSGVDLYVDGKYAGTTTTTPRANAFAVWQIGSRHGGVISGEAKYSGLIDDIRVYASALSTDQMIALGDSMGLYSAFRIQPIPTIEYNPLSMPYPEVIVSDKNTGEILSEGSDYEVAYSNANYVGTATVYVTGCGSYTGEKAKVNYQIVSDYFLPTGYRQLEYIRSTGTQYIKTGMLPTANTTVELKFNAKDAVNDGTFFGQGWGNSNFLFIRQNDKFKFFGTGTVVGDLSDDDLTAYVTTNNDVVIDYGEYATTTAVSRTASTANAFNIFADNGGNHKGSWTFYSMKIATNGDLQRDYVPAERESDGAIGLYDRANNVFYANQGTGAFVAGRYADEVLKIDPIPTQVTDFGLAVEPSPVVRSLMTGELLSEGTDYEVSCARHGDGDRLRPRHLRGVHQHDAVRDLPARRRRHEAARVCGAHWLAVRPARPLPHQPPGRGGFPDGHLLQRCLHPRHRLRRQLLPLYGIQQHLHLGQERLRGEFRQPQGRPQPPPAGVQPPRRQRGCHRRDGARLRRRDQVLQQPL